MLMVWQIDEIDNFLENCNLAKLTLDGAENLNSFPPMKYAISLLAFFWQKKSEA